MKELDVKPGIVLAAMGLVLSDGSVIRLTMAVSEGIWANKAPPLPSAVLELKLLLTRTCEKRVE